MYANPDEVFSSSLSLQARFKLEELSGRDILDELQARTRQNQIKIENCTYLLTTVLMQRSF